MINQCECPLAGFCNNAGRNVQPAIHKICQQATPAQRESLMDGLRKTVKKPITTVETKQAPKPITLDTLGIHPDQQERIVAVAESRGMLIGDVIAELTAMIGIPQCGGCKKRKEWVNATHLKIKNWLEGK
jgi:hypothetical protein